MIPFSWDEIRDGDSVLTAEGWQAEQMLRDETVYEKRTDKTSPLKLLFDYWNQTRRDNFEPIRDLNTRIHAVNVDTEWPFAFHWIGHNGLTFGSLAGQSVGDVVNNSIAIMTAEHYLRAKTHNRPLYHHIEQSVGALSREYTRLLLPPVNGILYYAVRPISISWQ